MSCYFFKVVEMEAILQQHNNTMPSRDVLVALAEKFRCALVSFNFKHWNCICNAFVFGCSESDDRKGKITVQMKQV